MPAFGLAGAGFAASRTSVDCNGDLDLPVGLQETHGSRQCEPQEPEQSPLISL